jgi:hypothetical protein
MKTLTNQLLTVALAFPTAATLTGCGKQSGVSPK